MKKKLKATNKTKLFTLLVITFISYTSLAQDYYWTSTSNRSFFTENNWSSGSSSGSNLSANSINANVEINHNLIIENAQTYVGQVWGNIKTGSGTLTLNKSQLVVKSGKNYGIDMGTGKTITLNDARIHSDYISNATITTKNNSQIYIYNTNNALNNTTINIKNRLSKIFFTNVKPSDVEANYLNKISVWGVAATNGVNVHIMPYYNGTMISPKGQDNAPITVYDATNYQGNSNDLSSFNRLTDNNIPLGNNTISSLILRRGYIAVLAENNDGTGERHTFIADKDDLFIADLGDYSLNNKVSLIRIMQWRQVNKKGNAAWVSDDLNNNLNLDWFYNWSDWKTPTLDSEYVTMVWGGDLVATGQTETLINNYANREDISTVLAFNEPDPCYMQSGQFYNMCDVDTAIGYYKELLALGLRIGAPAVTGSPDGFEWLDNFMTKATALNLHVDFIPVHYYGQVDANTFMSYWETIYNKWKLPIWVTEFNYGGPWETHPTTTVHNDNIKEWINAMDNADYIERYAFFSFSPDEYHGLWSSINNGTLNELGNWYKNHEATRAYADFQTMNDCNGTYNGYAFIDNCGKCVSGSTKTIIENSCTSGKEEIVTSKKTILNEDEISIYPNPVNNYLKIDINLSEVYVDIYSVTGKKVFSEFIKKGNNNLNLSSLKTGIYLMKIKKNNTSKVIKITKK